MSAFEGLLPTASGMLVNSYTQTCVFCHFTGGCDCFSGGDFNWMFVHSSV